MVHQSEKGYGAALMARIEGAHGQIIVMGDSDDSYDWESIGDFVHKISEGHDLVMGNRFRGGIEKGAMPWHHRYFGNPVLSTIARWFCKAPIGDFHCGMRAFIKDGYLRMNLQTKGMEFASEMIVSAARNNLKIAEIPTKLYPNKRSRPPHLRSFRDGWRHLKFLMTYAPDHVLLWPGLALFLPGLLLMALLCFGPITLGGFYMGAHFLALGCMMTMLGTSALSMWMLSSRVLHRKHPYLKTTPAFRILQQISTEKQLVFGAILVVIGLSIDGAILWHWLQSGAGPMEESVHPAFAATTLVEVGLNFVFNAFVLNLIASES